MNSTRPLSGLPIPSETGFISDEAYMIIDNALGFIMFAISLVGVVTNTLNVRTFILMGLRDGVSISLLGLSLSDLGVTSFGSIVGGAIFIGVLEMRYEFKNLPIQPTVITLFAANISFVFYIATCLTTTFLAVARCMCVAMPFKFKNTFTPSRSIFAQVVFTCIGMASYFPVLSQMGAQRKFDPMVNKTRVVVWVSNMRSDFKDVVGFFHFIIVVFASTLVVFISVLIMAKYLRQSVKFRNSSSSAAKPGNDASDKSGNDAKETSGNKLSGKELQVVRQVIVICIIYTACMLPSIIFTIYRYSDDDFDVGKKQQNFYYLSSSMGVILSIVNSSTTLPVYYVYNSKFRSLLFSTSGNGKNTSRSSSCDK